ncbi:hypothetical protein [Shimazuella kribbensis]|uniref:hypothetical protein n=1 Tax=Shimazuella kribbensis TaxID=139808 RepID=UPI00041B3633|nr:hypothetical protein [Shimazuella kribbensis]
MFLLSIMSFFIFAISGVQLVSGGYLLVGIPTLVVSGLVPILSSFWSSQQNYSSDGSWNDGSSDDGDISSHIFIQIASNKGVRNSSPF